MPTSKEDYGPTKETAWCPGCGNFAIRDCLIDALVLLDLPPHRVVVCSGIGQGPKLPHYMKVNTFNGLHGREVASAVGVKLAADDLVVIVHAGDGGAYGEGGNHLLHAIRRNIDMTLVVHDNKTYGLTKGQASPTSEEGLKTAIQPGGIACRALNPLALAISQDCSFVAQGFVGRRKQLVDLMAQAIKNPGFSLLNVLQPCVTWDKVHTWQYYNETCIDIPADHDPFDLAAAFELSVKQEGGIPLGVLYRNERPSYQDRVLSGLPRPLRDKEPDPEMVRKILELLQ